MTEDIAAAAADAPQLLGTGKMAEVVSHGSFALKRYRAGGKDYAFHEGAVLALLERLGLPAPRVEAVRQFDGLWGVLMTRAPGKTFADAVIATPEQTPRFLAAMVELHRQMHASVVPALGSLKLRLGTRIAGAGQLDEGTRRRLIELLSALPDGDRLCHGDFHPYNVLGEPGSAVIVDWLDATRGEPAADLCRSYLLIGTYSQELAETYLEAYLAAETAFARGAVLAWLPVLAAARLAENVPEETERLVTLAATA